LTDLILRIPYVILRPSIIYGLGDSNGISNYFNAHNNIIDVVY